jgi:catechol 2,3-dioxygenase-like lactoylglutathione lyase family enzyme
MDLQPHHIGIVVADLARSTAFYEALGFAESSANLAEDGSRAIRFMRLSVLQVELFWYAEPLSPEPAGESAARGRLGFRHLALSTGDLDGALAELTSAGVVPADIEVKVVPPGHRLAFFKDPDGIEIEIMEEASR